MWRKLRKQIAVEREMIHQLLKDHVAILRTFESSAPGPIEVSAMAALLHAFYNGVENLFKRVRVELDEGMPTGDGWHKALLASMTVPGPHRPAMISPGLAERIGEYLAFRHFFRSAYLFQIRWDDMKGLVMGVEETLRLLEGELDVFLNATETMA